MLYTVIDTVKAINTVQTRPTRPYPTLRFEDGSGDTNANKSVFTNHPTDLDNTCHCITIVWRPRTNKRERSSSEPRYHSNDENENYIFKLKKTVKPLQ